MGELLRKYREKEATPSEATCELDLIYASSAKQQLAGEKELEVENKLNLKEILNIFYKKITFNLVNGVFEVFRFENKFNWLLVFHAFLFYSCQL